MEQNREPRANPLHGWIALSAPELVLKITGRRVVWTMNGMGEVDKRFKGKKKKKKAMTYHLRNNNTEEDLNVLKIEKWSKIHSINRELKREVEKLT